MVGAWAVGRLDKELATVRPNDRHWWRRIHLKLAAQEADLSAEYIKATHVQALAGVTAGDADTANSLWKKAHARVDELFKLRFPWVKPEKVDSTKLVKDWEAAFGKRDDPKMKAAEAATVAWLTSH